MTKHPEPPPRPNEPTSAPDKDLTPAERIRRLLEMPAPPPRWVDPTRKDHVKPR